MTDKEDVPLNAPEAPSWADASGTETQKTANPAIDTEKLDRLLKNKAPQTQGGLFKEVNELRNVDHSTDDENAKYKDSFFGRLAGNNYFQGVTFFFIGMNSLYIGVDADYSARTGKPDDLWDPKTPIGFVLMENLFCVYFTIEVAIRFIAYKRKVDSLFDPWFVFDFILVAFMVLETWIFPIFGIGGALAQLSVLRLLRLLRISRMARLMKKVPELMIIIKGLIASVRSVGCTAILQVLILYVWSILFVSEYHYSDESLESDDTKVESFFGTMGKSMFSLFIYGTILDDVTYCSDVIRETGNTFYLFLFILFILISSFTILNMLIGILCEVVSATADSEKAKAAETCVKEAITTLFTTLDVDGSGNITEEEFKKMHDDESVRSALEDMDIYESHFARYCEVLFHKETTDGKEATIDFETLINMILRLQPGNRINALDFSLLQASIDSTQENLRERILKIHEYVKDAAKTNGVALPETKAEATKRMFASLQMGGSMSEEGSRPPTALSVDPNNPEVLEMRTSGQGEPPPLPPLADGQLRGTAAAADPGAAAPTKEYTLDMFVRTSSHEIIEELQRRLGVAPLEGSKPVVGTVAGVSPPVKTEAQPQEAFPSLAVPDSASP